MAEWCVRRRAWILGAIGLLSAGAAALLLSPGLHRDYTLRAFIASEDDSYRVFRRTMEQFTSNELALIAVRSDQALSARSQAIVADLVEQLRGVPSVQHLTSWVQIPAAIRTLLGDRLMSHPLVQGNLLSADHTTAAIVLQMAGEGTPASGWNASEHGARQANGELRRAVVARLRDIVGETRRRNPDVEIILAGPYVTLIDMYAYVDRDLIRFSCAAFVLLALTLGIVLRGWRPALLTVGGGLAAMVCTLALPVVFSLSVALIVQMIVILVVVLTVGNGVQLAVDYEACARAETDARSTGAAAARMLRRMAWPCTAAMVTTMAGFGSVCISRLSPVRTFGALMAVGLGLGLVFGLALSPMLRAQRPPPPAPMWDRRVAQGLARAAQLACRRRRWLFLVYAGATLGVGAGLARLHFESDFVRNFRPHSEVRRSYEFIEKNLTPLGAVDIVIRRRDGGTIVSPRTVQCADDVGRRAVADFPHVIRQAMSAADLIRLGESGGPTLGTDLSLRLMLASCVLGDAAVRNFLSADETAMRINLRAVEGVSVWEKLRVVEGVQRMAQESFGRDFEVTVTGLYPFYAGLVAQLVRDQYGSFAIAAAAIYAVFAAWLRSLRLACIAMIPNAIPVAACIGTMGWLGVPINMTTVMMLSVVFGISVDSTIHYLWRCRELFSETGDYAAAIDGTSRGVGRACLFTGVVVIGGFWILTLSAFLPTAYFGGLVGYTMLWALAADLTLLPALIHTFRPFGNEPGRAPAASADPPCTPPPQVPSS